MEILYQGVDITDMVQVKACTSRDTSDNRCDSLDIEFENASGWYNWEPNEDDQIIVSYNGYDTGIMYLNAVLPADGTFRIIATSLPSTARTKACQSFTGKTIEEIMRICAMSCGMGFEIYGINAGTVIPYIQRENEGCAAFLHRLLKMEGAALKCVNGKFVAIGYDYAQSLDVYQTIEVTADQPGIEYKRNAQSLYSLTVKTPYAQATAVDLSVPTERGNKTIYSPARDNIQAGRWARALLYHENSKSESLTIESAFNPGFTAMTRIDVEGATDAAGEWLVKECCHDFFNLRSTAKMQRCISTIQ